MSGLLNLNQSNILEPEVGRGHPIAIGLLPEERTFHLLLDADTSVAYYKIHVRELTG